MKYTFLLLSIFVFHYVSSATYEKQLMEAVRKVRNACLRKTKATDDQVDGMHDGDFDLDKHGQCYLHCIFNTFKLLKSDNTLDWKATIQVLKANLPPHVADPGTETIKRCKDAVHTVDDKCTASTEIARCIYKDNPGNYFLP